TMQLIRVKGISTWTAEMFLIITLGRVDVLAIDDVGIQRAAKWLYQVEKSERRQILVDKSHVWKPYRSVVSFYLWEAIHLGDRKSTRLNSSHVSISYAVFRLKNKNQQNRG